MTSRPADNAADAHQYSPLSYEIDGQIKPLWLTKESLLPQ
jgi:hypothetical protein